MEQNPYVYETDEYPEPSQLLIFLEWTLFYILVLGLIIISPRIWLKIIKDILGIPY